MFEKYDKNKDLSKINENKLILFVGSGISSLKPSNLPLGRELTEYYLELAMGKELKDIFLKKWSTLKFYFSSMQSEIELPRLEFIIGCVDTVDSEFQNKIENHIINGFRSFNNAPYNKNHECINILNNKGALIITTNFDNLIEKKNPNEYNDINKTKDKQDEYLYYSKLDNELNSIIYYIHGKASNPENLGATIKNIKKKPPQKLIDDFKSKLEDEYSLIFLGYSASDFFDITPLFKSFEENKYQGHTIFFEHFIEDNQNKNAKKNTNEYEAYQKMKSNKIDNFLIGFKNRKTIHGDTTTFLEDLVGIFEKTEFNYDADYKYDWKSNFNLSINKEYEKYQILYTIRIINQLGLNFLKDFIGKGIFKQFKNIDDLVDKAIEIFFEKLGINKNISDDELIKVIDLYLSQSEDISKLIIHDLKEIYKNYECEHKKLKIISETIENFRNSSKVSYYNKSKKVKYNELVAKLSANLKKRENIETLEVYAFNRYVHRMIIQTNILYSTNKAKRKLSVLFELSEKMISYPYSEYEFLSYYISIFKSNQKISSFLSEEDYAFDIEKYLPVIKISLEICSIDLVCDLLMNKVLCNALYYNRYSNNVGGKDKKMMKNEYLEKNIEYFKKLRDMLEIIDSGEHKKKHLSILEKIADYHAKDNFISNKLATFYLYKYLLMSFNLKYFIISITTIMTMLIIAILIYIAVNL